MKTIILAGGLGSRLDEITKIIPKPLVKIGKLPILIHIIKIFIKYNHTDFIIALGYKGEKIVEYFINRKITKKEKKKLITGLEVNKNYLKKKCKITFIETGLKTLTGGRVKRASKLVKDDIFFLTYGDGVADINLNKLLKQHLKTNKLATVTAVNPPARFGELKMNSTKVISFSEKKPIKQSWINGGFFVMNKKFVKYIKGDNTILERDPLEKITKLGELSAYKHHGFWQCMDTKRDKNILEKILKKF
jgi:glucose-1-phosphate cytidylyltransferase